MNIEELRKIRDDLEKKREEENDKYVEFDLNEVCDEKTIFNELSEMKKEFCETKDTILSMVETDKAVEYFEEQVKRYGEEAYKIGAELNCIRILLRSEAFYLREKDVITAKKTGQRIPQEAILEDITRISMSVEGGLGIEKSSINTSEGKLIPTCHIIADDVLDNLNCEYEKKIFDSIKYIINYREFREKLRDLGYIMQPANFDYGTTIKFDDTNDKHDVLYPSDVIFIDFNKKKQNTR